ncbi:MAG: flavodoxin family protein [Actinobacteria bacterium]|nr:flavodoxin family protein [Actinomycetota bacterium]
MDAGAPKILCILGSPRRHGNSEQLLDACVSGITDSGVLVDRLAVVEHAIEPCVGCGGCGGFALSGACVIQDDMSEIYPRIDAAAAIVVASPVYFATVPASLKALYDRCQPYWERRHARVSSEAIAGVPMRRKGALLLVGAGGDPFGFDAAIATTRSVFANLEIDYTEEILAEGPDQAGDILRYPEILRSAVEVGRRLAKAVHRQQGL